MLAQRYALIHQRLLRHELFRPTDLLGHTTASTSSSGQHTITPVESLLGNNSNNNTGSKTLLLLGMLVQIEQGKYYLEDPTGQVRVSFQDASAVDAFFVVEQSILLMEGSFHDGLLLVHRIGQPFVESRHDSLRAIQQQVTHAMYRSPTSIQTSTSSDGVFCVLSDVHLDQPRVLIQLEGLLAKYDREQPATCFVLMGNFSSSDSSNTVVAWDDLATLLTSFVHLARHAHFVLVPGPSDGVGQVLPLPQLQGVHMPRRLERVHLATNPCRLYWQGQELVIARYDVLHVLQRQQILVREDVAVDEKENEENLEADDSQYRRRSHCRLVTTMLDQAHLLPCAGVPIFWNYDHALRLYPLPDALILGGDRSKGFHEIYGGCNVIHAGSLGYEGTYATFYPNGKEVDPDESENDSVPATTAVVEFECLNVSA
jgi:DNA polymerase epsilon subunit 2